MRLAYAEYTDLGLGERLALLRALSAFVLDAEVMHEWVTEQSEALTLPLRKHKVCCAAAHVDHLTKAECAAHQLDTFLCAYVRIYVACMRHLDQLILQASTLHCC